MNLFYEDAAKPHQVTSFAGTAVGHDDNGNRENRNWLGNDYTYTYDPEDRLTEVETPSGTVRFRYDYTGTRVLVDSPSGPQRYFGSLAESNGSYLYKHYFAGGMRLATREAFPWTPSAMAPDSEQTFFARLMDALPAHRNAHRSLSMAAATVFVVLVVVPGRRRMVGITLRRGHVLAMVLVFAAGPSGLPFGATAAFASGGGCCNPPPPSGTDLTRHYHLDHLGSTQLITDAAGEAYQHIRYWTYGEVRYRSGTGVAPRYEFTGYENDPHSGLQYAGARFYDPMLGSFLTHDPARQFASPYTYTNWDPVNLTDPTGALTGLETIAILVLVAFAAGAAAAGIQAAVNGATWEKSLAAAGIGGAISGASALVTAGIVNFALPAAVSALHPALVSAGLASGTAEVAAANAVSTVSALGFFGSVGQAAYGLSQGDYSGVIGLGISIGILYACAQGANRKYSGTDKYIAGDSVSVSDDNATVGGIEVMRYRENASGLDIQLGYDAGSGSAPEARWVQTIDTNVPIAAESPYLDPYPPHEHSPFYFRSADLPNFQNQGRFELLFVDHPSRKGLGLSHVRWQAELSLVVPSSQGSYRPLVTLRYGFKIHHGSTTLLPLEQTSPSGFHRSQIP